MSASTAAPRPVGARPGRRRLVRLPYGWPVTALFAGLGAWWLVGLHGLAVHLVAVPMLVHLVRSRRVVVAPGAAVWGLFLLWCAASTVMLGVDPAGTVPDTFAGRLVPAAFRLSGYAAAAVVLLYIGNLDPVRFSQRRLARVLGLGFVWVVLGGLLAVVAPQLELTSPVELLLPPGVRSNLFVQSLVHPAASQVQDVLGYAAGRPAAPFGYTNMWGHAFALLLPWFVVGFVLPARGARRLAALAVLGVSVLPAVLSLNRGLWVALALSVAFVVVRAVRRGRTGVAVLALAAVLLTALLLLASPLRGVVEARVENGRSDSIRSYSVTRAVELTTESPLLGFGSTRTPLGGVNSIATGRTSDCPRCGNQPLGVNGQLWYEVVAHGFVGAALYVLTLVLVAWRHRRLVSPVGTAGLLTVLLMLWFMLVYGAMTTPLAVAFAAWAALWREESA